jgi:hypothetical protein
MKNFRMVSVLLLVAIAACSQSVKKVNVPENVKAKVASLYPKVSPEWEMEDANYEASFTRDNVETSVILSPDGNILQTETTWDVASLPPAVSEFVSSQLGGKKIETAEKIVDANGMVTYEAEVDHTDYLFDENGNFKSKEKPETGEDEDKD